MSLFDEHGWYTRHPAETGGRDGGGYGFAAIAGIIIAIFLFICFKCAG